MFNSRSASAKAVVDEDSRRDLLAKKLLEAIDWLRNPSIVVSDNPAGKSFTIGGDC